MKLPALPFIPLLAPPLACSLLGSCMLCAALPHHFVRPPSTGISLILAGTGVMGCGVQLTGMLALKLLRCPSGGNKLFGGAVGPAL